MPQKRRRVSSKGKSKTRKQTTASGRHRAAQLKKEHEAKKTKAKKTTTRKPKRVKAKEEW